VPIITLISFLVGCIIAQQGIFQLQRSARRPSWSISSASSSCANSACC
jgi:ABC-type transporter Mla maintaining outer membrane lipid asymmetry permease subunit MlaE